jgi:hypothetical protein
MKKITIRKAGSVRLTSAASAAYAGGCGGTIWV